MSHFSKNYMVVYIFKKIRMLFSLGGNVRIISCEPWENYTVYVLFWAYCFHSFFELSQVLEREKNEEKWNEK